MAEKEESRHRLPGGSSVIDPYGHEAAGPLWDQEGSLYADLPMDKVPMSRMEFDVCGQYSRPDLLQLTVREEPSD